MSLRHFTPPPYQPIFSSKPGIVLWIPGSPCNLRVFPTAFQLFKDTVCLAQQEFLDLGEKPGFTAFVDAIHQRITVEGHGKNGFFRYRIEGKEEGVVFSPICGLSADRQLFSIPCLTPPFPMPRLSLGCNKASCWDRIAPRPSLHEIMPLWHMLGRGEMSVEADDSMLGSLAAAVHRQAATEVGGLVLSLFSLGISDIFVPKREDDLFLGYRCAAYPERLPLTAVHSAVSSVMASMFIDEKESIRLLPCLPKECPSGRFYNVPLRAGHLLSFEWRKGKLRRVLVHAAQDDQLFFSYPANGCSVRCVDRGERKRLFSFQTPLVVQKGARYLIDNVLLS